MFNFNHLPAFKTNLPTRQLSAFNRLAMVMLLLAGGVLSSGCSTLPSSLSSAGVIKNAPASPVSSSSQAQYLVDMQASVGGSSKYRGLITPGATVQTALEASGAIEKYRNMEVDVLRKIEGSYQPLKMACSYNIGKQTVQPETDYALKHGDRILVTPVSENQLLQILGTFASGK